MLFTFFPEQLLSLFKPSEQMLQIGVPALRIISISFLMAGFDIQCSSLFQSLGHGVLSMWSSIIRQLVALIPLAWLLSLSGNLELVWLAFPLAEVVTVLLNSVFLVRIIRRQIRPLEVERELEPALEEAGL